VFSCSSQQFVSNVVRLYWAVEHAVARGVLCVFGEWCVVVCGYVCGVWCVVCGGWLVVWCAGHSFLLFLGAFCGVIGLLSTFTTSLVPLSQAVAIGTTGKWALNLGMAFLTILAAYVPFVPAWKFLRPNVGLCKLFYLATLALDEARVHTDTFRATTSANRQHSQATISITTANTHEQQYQ
jgi:hypothetical protein